jgi:hypothetical protein
MTRDEFIDKQYAMLKEWSGQVDKLQAQLQDQMKAGSEAARAGLEKQVADLKRQQSEAEAQLAKIRSANEAAFQDMREGYERMAQTYQETLQRAWSRYKA